MRLLYFYCLKQELIVTKRTAQITPDNVSVRETANDQVSGYQAALIVPSFRKFLSLNPY
jgi:hypothetical protein